MVVGFRTHRWDDVTALLARRAAGAVAGSRFVVLADETAGPLDVEPFEKVSHSATPPVLGPEPALPVYPAQRTLWHNADYAVFALRAAFPEATLLVMIENDVLLNADLTPLLRRAVVDEVDFLATRIRPASPTWRWHEDALKSFPEPRRAWIQVLALTPRAVDALYRERQQQAQDPPQRWTYCEALIPSVLTPERGFTVLDLHRDVVRELDLSRFTATDPTALSDPRLAGPSVVAHPVLPPADVLRRRLLQDPPEAVLDASSELMRALRLNPDPEAVALLWWRAQADPRLSAELDVVRERLEALLAPGEVLPLNRALHRPADQSSTYRKGRAVTVDAARAVDGSFGDNSGFHTLADADPWWQVDLEREAPVSEVVLYHRVAYAERAARVRVALSTDGETWEEAYRHNGRVFRGASDLHPLRAVLEPAVSARYVRVLGAPNTVLHLDQVVVLTAEA